MAVIRKKEMKGYSMNDLNKKLGELRLELVKSSKPSQGASIKTREIRKTVARLLTKMNSDKNMKREDKSKATN